MALNKAATKTQTKKNKNVKVKVVKKSKKAAIKEKQSRVEILQSISAQTGLTRVDVEKVFDSLLNLMSLHLCKQGSGEFTVPKTGIKVSRYKKPARKERKMVSPLIGEEVVIEAKPSRQAVKLTALKPLKSLVE